MNYTEVNVKIPKKNELIIDFADEVCIDSVADFQKQFNERKAEIIDAYDIANKNLSIIGPNLKIKKQPIQINLNTPGGDCYSGLAMYDFIANTDDIEVNIVAQGHVMSMGIPILLSVPLEHRFAYKNTTFMLHSVSGVAIGCVEEMEDSISEINRMNKLLFNLITDNSNVTLEQLEHYKERKKDWIVDSQTALDLGLISKII
jgi:ATP-dependent protease ClpP protease subunit